MFSRFNFYDSHWISFLSTSFVRIEINRQSNCLYFNDSQRNSKRKFNLSINIDNTALTIHIDSPRTPKYLLFIVDDLKFLIDLLKSEVFSINLGTYHILHVSYPFIIIFFTVFHNFSYSFLYFILKYFITLQIFHATFHLSYSIHLQL